jgi:predicted metalloprotease with PDZ domain
VRVALVALVWAFASAAAVAQPCDLHYRVTPRHDSVPRVLDIELSFAPLGRSESYLRATAEWGGVTDFAASMTDWRGLDAGTRVAAGDSPRRWRVTHPAGAERVRVGWRVRAALPDPDDGRPQDQLHLYRAQIGADWFQFSGYSALVDVEHFDDRTQPRVCVDLLQPGAAADTPAFGSHLHARGPAASFALTGSPSLVRHAFYAGGAGWRVTERRLASGPVVTAVRGRFAVADAELADRSAALLDAHRRFWGDASAPPQWVVLTPNFSQGNVGGTLVHQAALLHAGPDFGPAHDAFAFLIGHENLHQWIPQRFGRLPEDGREAVPHYWFSEGFTNFYTHRLLLASGLWTLDRYAGALTRALRGYWRSPSRNAGARDIAPRFFSDRDAGQQMYARGELLALRWDRALRAQRHAGLDTVLKSLLLPAGPMDENTPMATERVLGALQPLLGDAPRREVQAHVLEGQTLPLDDATLAGPCFALRWDDVPRWSLGFDRASFGLKVAQGVTPGGPAFAAGLRDGMALVGWSVYGDDVTRDAELTVRTPDGERTLRYRPVHGSERLPTLAVRDHAAADAACREWGGAAPRP